MEQSSVTYQTVDYLGQTHEWTDTDVISSCKENMREPCSDVCINNPTKLWENGIVPYEFDNEMSLELKPIVLDAMKTISKVSSIRFVIKTDQLDYIKFVDKHCYESYVGKKGGEQELSVTVDSQKYPHPKGSTMHELMHALGFYHEHCHPDRDKYLTVMAKPNDRNFKKERKTDVVCFGPYDPDSIMHYPLGCYPKGQCIRAKWRTKRTNMGQRENLSTYDIKALNKLYPSKEVLNIEFQIIIGSNKFSCNVTPWWMQLYLNKKKKTRIQDECRTNTGQNTDETRTNIGTRIYNHKHHF